MTCNFAQGIGTVREPANRLEPEASVAIAVVIDTSLIFQSACVPASYGDLEQTIRGVINGELLSS